MKYCVEPMEVAKLSFGRNLLVRVSEDIIEGRWYTCEKLENLLVSVTLQCAKCYDCSTR